MTYERIMESGGPASLATVSATVGISIDLKKKVEIR